MRFFESRPRDLLRLFFSRQRSSQLGPVKKWCADHKLPYRQLDAESLNKVAAGTHHEGVVMVVRPQEPLPIHPFIREGLGRRGMAVALDRIGNTHNVGAILRTCAFFGADGLVLSSEEGQADLTSSAARTAEGAMEVTPVYRCSDLSSTLRDFKSRNVFVIGADLEAELSIYDVEVRFPCVVVLGNEQDGLSVKIKKRCDQVARIPGTDEVQSLNVSVAAGVILAHLCRRRDSGKQEPS
ncbi:tRNA methyltransferase [Candidatus Nitromaritima sp. SCGC AAA799-A02]|nr:tRNA methyltransferase [Candidatus Nitromaritima sp. SCGC AAA799-A02]